MQALFLAILAYLIGSIPFGFLVGRYIYGVDIRTIGSQNIGTTNAFRNLGAAAGALVLAGDLGKGLIAVLMAKVFAGTDTAMALSACGVIAGHNWPLFLRLRGGKGIATACGALLIFTPKILLILLLIWLVIVTISRYVSLGSIIVAGMFPVMVFILERDRAVLLVFSIVAGAVVIWRHKSNIGRLLDGTETKTTLIRRKEGDNR